MLANSAVTAALTASLVSLSSGGLGPRADGLVSGATSTVWAALPWEAPQVLLDGPVSGAATWALDLVAPWWGEPSAWWMLPLCAALLLLGSLLPDADSDKSLLGRHLPDGWAGPHRGITHTNWVLLGLLLPGLLFEPLRPLLWLFWGALLHDVVDGWSRAGRAAWWPLGRWREVSHGGTTMIVVDGRRSLYRAGQVSEAVVLVGLLAASAALLLVSVLP